MCARQGFKRCTSALEHHNFALFYLNNRNMMYLSVRF